MGANRKPSEQEITDALNFLAEERRPYTVADLQSTSFDELMGSVNQLDAHLEKLISYNFDRSLKGGEAAYNRTIKRFVEQMGLCKLRGISSEQVINRLRLLRSSGTVPTDDVEYRLIPALFIYMICERELFDNQKFEDALKGYIERGQAAFTDAGIDLSQQYPSLLGITNESASLQQIMKNVGIIIDNHIFMNGLQSLGNNRLRFDIDVGVEFTKNKKMLIRYKDGVDPVLGDNPDLLAVLERIRAMVMDHHIVRPSAGH
jgi:hypothetical protein